MILQLKSKLSRTKGLHLEAKHKEREILMVGNNIANYKISLVKIRTAAFILKLNKKISHIIVSGKKSTFFTTYIRTR